MDFAEELVRRHLIGAAEELLALAGHAGARADPSHDPSGNKGARPTAGAVAALGPGSSNADREASRESSEPVNGKERVRSLLQRMEGCLRGARSLLPDFPHARPPGEPLTVVGSVRCLSSLGLACSAAPATSASQYPAVHTQYSVAWNAVRRCCCCVAKHSDSCTLLPYPDFYQALLTTAGRAQAGVSLRLPEARAVASRAVAAAVGYAGAQDAETLTLAMRVRSQPKPNNFTYINSRWPCGGVVALSIIANLTPMAWT